MLKYLVVASVYDPENDNSGITLTSEDFFNNYDAYILKIEANKITILGKDTDAVYYGITTLERILDQVTAGEVETMRINDYATAKWRGIIEGYYGIPYSNEDIMSLMEFGSDFKMNTFIYAPKDDPYHNSKWRESLIHRKLWMDLKRLSKRALKQRLALFTLSIRL